MKNNKYNYCSLKIPLNSLLSFKQTRKISEVYDVYSFVKFKFKENSLNLSFLQFLRRINWKKKYIFKAFFSGKNLKLEEKILNLAFDVLFSQSQEFETSLEEDFEALKNSKSHRHYFAVYYR